MRRQYTVATVVEARYPWGASPDATIATDATVVMLSGVVTNASEKSVCPFPDVDERGLPPAKRRKTRFSQQVLPLMYVHLLLSEAAQYLILLLPGASDQSAVRWWLC